MKENVELIKTIRVVSMVQISESVIYDTILNELKGRELFIDTDSDSDEKIYSGDVFEELLGEYAEMNKMGAEIPSIHILKQLEMLADLSKGEYLHLTVPVC